MKRWASLAAGAAANVALLAAPTLVFGPPGRICELGPLVVLGVATAGVVSEAAAVGQRREATGPSIDARARRLAGMTGLVLWLVFATSMVGAGSQLSGGIWPLFGGVTMALGVGLRRAAIAALGLRFRTEVTVGSGHALVTDGVFARRRHPSELGLVLLASGAGVATGSTVALALVVAVLFPLVLVRIRLEESALLQAFGRRYRDYSRRTPRLFGRVG